MSATFRCKRSGNTVTFSNENDIEGMRKHEGYDEVIEVPAFLRPADPVTFEAPEIIEPKRRGRPRRES